MKGKQLFKNVFNIFFSLNILLIPLSVYMYTDNGCLKRLIVQQLEELCAVLVGLKWKLKIKISKFIKNQNLNIYQNNLNEYNFNLNCIQAFKFTPNFTILTTKPKNSISEVCRYSQVALGICPIGTFSHSSLKAIQIKGKTTQPSLLNESASKTLNKHFQFDMLANTKFWLI